MFNVGLSLIVIITVIAAIIDISVTDRTQTHSWISCPNRDINITAERAEYFEDAIVYKVKNDKVRVIERKYGCVIRKATIDHS